MNLLMHSRSGNWLACLNSFYYIFLWFQIFPKCLALLCDKHVQLDVFAHLKIATHIFETDTTSVLHIRFDSRQRVPCLSIYFAPLRHKARYSFLFCSDLPVLQHVCGSHWVCMCVVCGFHGSFTASWLCQRPCCCCCGRVVVALICSMWLRLKRERV